MTNQTTYEDVFRFKLMKPITEPTKNINLQSDTSFYKVFRQAQKAQRQALALEKLNRYATREDLMADLQVLPAIAELIAKTDSLEKKKKLSQFLKDHKIAINKKIALPHLSLLSDLLLAWYYSPADHSNLHMHQVQELYIYYHLYYFETEYSDLVITLQDFLEESLCHGLEDFPMVGKTNNPIPGLPNKNVKIVGVSDLMVVKKQLVRYEPTEIGYIENIMAKETRNRTLRMLDKTEETRTFSSENFSEKQTEYETNERFELKKEVGNTIKTDTKFGAELNVSGKYGPAIEFSSEVSGQYQRQAEDVNTSASNYAKDILDRSVEKVSERVKEEQITKIIREREDTNFHGFLNDTENHISGIYQFIDKIFLSQVFNYGKHAMFDLMIPEPASYIMDVLENTAGGQEPLPEPPPEINFSPKHIHDDPGGAAELYYMNLIDKFQASNIGAPPVEFLHVSKEYENSGEKTISESGNPKRVKIISVELPEGYCPKEIIISGVALTDTNANQVKIVCSVHKAEGIWKDGASEVTATLLESPNRSLHGNISLTLDDGILYEPKSKLHISILSYETANFSLNFNVKCKRADSTLQAWQLNTFGRLLAGNRDQKLAYDAKVAQINYNNAGIAGGIDISKIGLPPSQKEQIIKTELKKHAISILTQQWFETFNVYNAEHDKFNIQSSMILGNFIRFFEQAFEWSEIQYAFYPYFWAGKETQNKRFIKIDSNYEYQQFLQAGSARVVLPIRAGFTRAMIHYLDTGKIWNGMEELPRIGNQLYLAIVDEIKGSQSLQENAVPVGKPWEVRMPTTLILLKQNAVLPEWQKVQGSVWNWKPKE